MQIRLEAEIERLRTEMTKIRDDMDDQRARFVSSVCFLSSLLDAVVSNLTLLPVLFVSLSLQQRARPRNRPSRRAQLPSGRGPDASQTAQAEILIVPFARATNLLPSFLVSSRISLPPLTLLDNTRVISTDLLFLALPTISLRLV